MIKELTMIRMERVRTLHTSGGLVTLIVPLERSCVRGT
jgi:hypothetical protein